MSSSAATAFFVHLLLPLACATASSPGRSRALRFFGAISNSSRSSCLAVLVVDRRQLRLLLALLREQRDSSSVALLDRRHHLARSRRCAAPPSLPRAARSICASISAICASTWAILCRGGVKPRPARVVRLGLALVLRACSPRGALGRLARARGRRAPASRLLLEWVDASRLRAEHPLPLDPVEVARGRLSVCDAFASSSSIAFSSSAARAIEVHSSRHCIWPSSDAGCGRRRALEVRAARRAPTGRRTVPSAAARSLASRSTTRPSTPPPASAGSPPPAGRAAPTRALVRRLGCAASGLGSRGGERRAGGGPPPRASFGFFDSAGSEPAPPPKPPSRQLRHAGRRAHLGRRRVAPASSSSATFGPKSDGTFTLFTSVLPPPRRVDSGGPKPSGGDDEPLRPRCASGERESPRGCRRRRRRRRERRGRRCRPPPARRARACAASARGGAGLEPAPWPRARGLGAGLRPLAPRVRRLEGAVHFGHLLLKHAQRRLRRLVTVGQRLLDAPRRHLPADARAQQLAQPLQPARAVVARLCAPRRARATRASPTCASAAVAGRGG